MSGYADSLTSCSPAPSATYFRESAPDPRTDQSSARLYRKKEFTLRIASSAVTPGASRQRPSLDSMGFQHYESRTLASLSGFERHAATSLLSPACPGADRDGALPWTSVLEGPAAVHPKEFSCRKNWLSARLPMNGGSPSWKKVS